MIPLAVTLTMFLALLGLTVWREDFGLGAVLGGLVGAVFPGVWLCPWVFASAFETDLAESLFGLHWAIGLAFVFMAGLCGLLTGVLLGALAGDLAEKCAYGLLDWAAGGEQSENRGRVAPWVRAHKGLVLILFLVAGLAMAGLYWATSVKFPAALIEGRMKELIAKKTQLFADGPRRAVDVAPLKEEFDAVYQELMDWRKKTGRKGISASEGDFESARLDVMVRWQKLKREEAEGK